MEKLTYKQAYNKIIDAYFKDEIKPFDSRFCFCGTLSPDPNWDTEDHINCHLYPYKVNEYMRMEKALFTGFPEVDYMGIQYVNIDRYTGNNYEQELFNGMCSALEVLKQIHADRGEVIEEDLPFTKRQLQAV